MTEFAITFAAGASYGLTTVIVGQPLDTIKTRMQAIPSTSNQNMMRVGRNLFMQEGVRGLYRGGFPLLAGGSLMRSAQFGVSGKVNDLLKQSGFPELKFLGLFDCRVILSGIAGGLGRGLVEAPTDFLKIRRQVDQKWAFGQVLSGMWITLARNTFLYTSFVLYIDLSKQACRADCVPVLFQNEEGNGLTPFGKGAICANLAWMTIWPWDVVKSQRQSGNYANQSAISLIRQNIRNGNMFRGLLPGLARSTLANGCSMVIYEKVHRKLSSIAGVGRKDLT